MQAYDLNFEPDSTLGPVDLAKVGKFVQWLNKFNELSVPITLDAAYVAHLSKYHGGIPRRRLFKTARGVERLVDRFLNFQEEQGAQSEYSIPTTLSWVAGERFGRHLVPFAVLFGGDLLCFNYRSGSRPTIVVWLHELSTDEKGPCTEFVSNDFDDFMKSLYEAG